MSRAPRARIPGMRAPPNYLVYYPAWVFLATGALGVIAAPFQQAWQPLVYGLIALPIAIFSMAVAAVWRDSYNGWSEDGGLTDTQGHPVSRVELASDAFATWAVNLVLPRFRSDRHLITHGRLERLDQTDWTALLAAGGGVRLQSGASIDDLNACEAALGSHLPPQLRSLYSVSDGVWDEAGQWFVIWPLGEVTQRNRLANDVEGPARSRWIGFADDGTGDPFCVDRLGGTALYHWSPIDQTATPMAIDLEEFWTAWVAGNLPPY